MSSNDELSPPVFWVSHRGAADGDVSVLRDHNRFL
jgi:hypothetical protein